MMADWGSQMSNGDGNEGRKPSEAPVCGAEELKGLLQRIAVQIADTDRRHTETLSQMQGRLGSLGDEARSMRSRVPAEFAPAFERIEEGMALLAERIAGAGATAQRREQPWAAFQQAEAQPAAPAVVQQAPVPAAAAAPPVQAAAQPAEAAQAPTSVPPPALRSASAGVNAAVPRAPVLDPFDFIDNQTKSPTGEWEPEDADALTRIYESGQAGLPPAVSKPAAAAGAAQVVQTVVAREGLVEKEWLEERLGEIADRLQISIKDARADTAISALGVRFDHFEKRFDAAMQDVATRADVEGLRLVEAHINELATHLEQTVTHLQRLDTIEGQLNVVVDQLSDDRFAALIERSAPDLDKIAAVAVEHAASRFAQVRSAQPEPDYERLADLAAERAAVQVAGLAGARGNDEHRIDDIKGLLEGFITERRQGDEQTASMLDTMQQAMIRVLDRMDSIENSQARAASLAAAAVAERPAAPQYAREPEPRPAPRVEPVRAAHPSIDASMVPRVTRSGGVTGEPPSADLGSPFDAESRSGQPRTKEDFIAAARRAARQAANEVPAAGGGTAALPKPKMPEPPVAEKKSGRSLFNLGRKSVLAMLVASIIVMAGALVMMKAGQPPVEVTEASQQGEAVEAQAADTTRVINGGQAVIESRQEAAEASPDHDAAEDKAGQSAADDHAAMPTQAEAMPAPQPQAQPRQQADAGGGVPGISLQSSRTPTLQDLSRLREQQDLAALSSRLGAAAAQATPASLLIEKPLGGEQSVAEAETAQEPVAAQKAVALPPATVGPMSLRVAASKGDPSAEFEVGARLAEGKGIDQNFADALSWYQRSAQKGFAQAQYRLATFFERGLGTKADVARASVWYKRAAEQGNVKAMHNLAVLSASRRSGSPDYATAAKWFAEAADRGLADSQFNLAVLYESGLGVPKDMRQAFKWMTIAARAGDAETMKRRERMRVELSRSDIEAADGLIRDWQPVAADPMANDARTAGEAWKRRTANANH